MNEMFEKIHKHVEWLEKENKQLREAYDTQARVHDKLNQDYIEVRDERNRYEQTLLALLNISAEHDYDVFIDIIVDALNGYGLDEQFQEDALEGTNFLAQFMGEGN